MTSLPVWIKLTAHHGDTWSQTFRFLDGTTPHDLTDATVAANARNGNGVLTPLVATVGDPGEITITAPGIPAGMYEYDVQITEVDGVLTWVHGRLAVNQDISP